MEPINQYFLKTNQSIDPHQLKSGCLRRLFNLSSNSIIAINQTEIDALLFIFEKNTPTELMFSSHLLLTCIRLNYPEMIHISNHQLILGSHPISTHIQRHTSQSGIFCHSITLRQRKRLLCRPFKYITKRICYCNIK